VRLDDEANPTKGVTAARELIYKEKVAVLFGGLDTPVSVAIVRIANQEKVPFMGPWAAGTAITQNGASPNFAFRVSAVDELVDKGMLTYAQKTFKASKPGMILVNNAWGESNEKGLSAALAAKGVQAAGIEKFGVDDVDVVPQLTRLKLAGADVLLLVGNVGPSAQVVKSLDRMGWKVPVVSHWGPAGGRFSELYGWDSYFIVLGLLQDHRNDLARGMVDNLLYEVQYYGKTSLPAQAGGRVPATSHLRFAPRGPPVRSPVRRPRPRRRRARQAAGSRRDRRPRSPAEASGWRTRRRAAAQGVRLRRGPGR